MIAIALLHDHYDVDHLKAVVSDMRTMGAPIIRAVDLGEGVWAALEGCHRIRAAAELGLTPVLVPVEYSETVTTDDLGMTADFDGDTWTIAQLVDDAWQREIVRFAA
jgi:hypothetical protein